MPAAMIIPMAISTISVFPSDDLTNFPFFIFYFYSGFSLFHILFFLPCIGVEKNYGAVFFILLLDFVAANIPFDGLLF